MKKQYKKALAAALAVSLGWNLIPNIPYVHASQTSHYTVDDIEALPDDILYQQVEFGTEEKDLELPDTLKMLVRPEEEDGVDAGYIETATWSNADRATSSNAEDMDGMDGDWRMVRVEWVLNEPLSEAVEYDGEQPGIYVFDAEFTNDRYRLGETVLPTIEVEVLEEAAAGVQKGAGGLIEKRILSWQWLDPEGYLTETEEGKYILPLTASEETPASLEEVMELLPEEMTAKVAYSTEEAGENPETGTESVTEETISLEGWSCTDYPEDGAYEGEYTFTPRLPEAYGFAEETPEPAVQVQFHGAMLLVDGYGTWITRFYYSWQSNDSTWDLYDTDGDNEADRVVISGETGTGAASVVNEMYQITSVIIEEGITSITGRAFLEMRQLETVSILGTVMSIGDKAFLGCYNLKHIDIPSTVLTIGDEAFRECIRLQSIEIPEGVESIGANAFRDCPALTSVSLPDTLKTIGNSAFEYCGEIEKIIIPENVIEMGEDPFPWVKAVYNLSDHVEVGWLALPSAEGTVYTITQKGRDGEADKIQKVLPSDAAAGTRYAGTAYDAASYLPNGEGNGWVIFDEESGSWTEVKEEADLAGNPVLYPIRTMAWNDISAKAQYIGGDDLYTLAVTDSSTGETLREGIHYTQKITSENGFDENEEATSDGTQAGRVTVTITGIPEGGYFGTREVSFLISMVASVKLGEDGEETYFSIEEAWAAAQGQTAEVKLLSNVQVSETLTVTDGSDITLTSGTDGNSSPYAICGNVSSADSGLIDIAAGGTFTLKSGIVENGESGTNAVAVTGGHFILDGGTVIAKASGESGVCVYSGRAEFKSGSASGYNGAANVGAEAFLIYGGTFTGTSAAVHLRNVDGSSTMIYGGTFTGDADAILLKNVNGTLQTILGDKKAYYEVTDAGNVLITDLPSDRLSLPGTITVEDCTHSCSTWTDTGNGNTHSGTCAVCGTVIDGPHEYDGNGFCTVCGGYEPAVWNETAGRYEISNGGQLFWFAQLVNGRAAGENSEENGTGGSSENSLERNPAASAVLTADIDLEDRLWTPIGTYSDENKAVIFSGNFDGGGHTIRGLSIKAASSYQGLFGYCGSGSRISSVTVEGSLEVTGNDVTEVGGIAGYMVEGTISDVVSNVTVYNSDSTVHHTGGVAGGLSDSRMERVINRGSVTTVDSTDCIAGVAGYIWRSTLENCANLDTVFSSGGDAYVGGIAGYSNTTNTIKNCYNYGTVSNDSAGTYCGAVIGWSRDSRTAMENCYYLDASSEKGVGRNGAPAGNKEPASEDGIFSKEESAFQSGEVAWLLNGGSVAEDGAVTEPAGNVWKQGSLGEAGSMPGFTGPDVYRTERCDGTVSYTNDSSLNGKQGHQIDENGLCGICGQQMTVRVAVGEKNYYYSDIHEAWTAAREQSSGEIPATVILLSDVFPSQPLTVEEGDNILLDSDGEGSAVYTVSGDWESGVICIQGGSFTLRHAGVKNTRADNDASGIEVRDGGVIIDGGEITSIGIMNYFGYGFGLWVIGGSVEIREGSIIKGAGFGVKLGTGASNESRNAHLTISGGTIIGENCIAMYVSGKENSLTVTGGEIRGNSAMFVYRNMDLASIKLSGGTFTGTTMYNIYVDGGAANAILKEGCAYYYEEEGTLVPVPDEDAQKDLLLVENGYGTVTVKDLNAEVIAVSVTWGGMNFTYTDGAWNPETHSYGEGSWKADDNSGNCITVENKGNVDVTVSYKYDPSVTAVSGRFSGDDGNFIDAPVTLAREGMMNAYLTLTGKPEASLDKATLGVVTVTIGGGK